MNGEGSAAPAAIDYEKFRRSLKRLEEQYANYRSPDVARPTLDQEGIAESVTRRFRICHDCLWKVLKRYLIEALGVADPPNGPKPIFRLAHENHLFRARWSNGSCTPTSATPPPTITTVKRPRPASTSWPTSSTTPSASTRP